jgi:hypothetical protein
MISEICMNVDEKVRPDLSYTPKISLGKREKPRKTS